MTRKSSGSSTWFAVLLIASFSTFAQHPTETEVPTPPASTPGESPAFPNLEVEDLSNGRFRLGRIEIDKPAHRFTVPGIVLRREPPVEFLAVMEGGFKAYEAIFELKANAYEFNMACLLIGLVPGTGTAPTYHFDPAVVEGDPVGVWVSFEGEGTPKPIDAAEMVRLGDRQLEPGQWIYTGSTFAPDGAYFAQMDGTLIGFVHDPSSIIEHATGLGLGNFGAVGPNAELLPSVGSPMKLTVEVRGTRHESTSK